MVGQNVYQMVVYHGGNDQKQFKQTKVKIDAQYRSFQKRGTPKWMVYNGKPY